MKYSIGIDWADKSHAVCIRAIVADELARSLAGLRFQSRPGDDEANTPETEDRYGARLDRMLGGLSAHTDPGAS
jgi:hypothetical protein